MFGRTVVLAVVVACGSPAAIVDAQLATGDAVAGDRDASPLAPDGIPGLQLWLDGAEGVTATGWADRSGASRNMVVVGGMITATTLHGHPAAHLNNNYMKLDANVPAFSADQGLVIAAAFASTTGGGILDIEGPATSNLLRTSAGNNASAQIGNDTVSVGGMYNDNQPHVLVASRQAGILTLRLDGAMMMQYAATSSLTLGGMIAYVGAGHPIIDYGEILLYAGSVSDAQITGVETYLSQKYRR